MLCSLLYKVLKSRFSQVYAFYKLTLCIITVYVEHIHVMKQHNYFSYLFGKLPTPITA